MVKPETLAHAMATRSRKKMIVAAVLPGGVFSYLAAKGRVKMEDGGPLITNPLVVGSNPNVTTATYYDTVPVDQTNELTTVSYEMTRLVGSLIMSDQEGDENQGDAVIVKILTAKLEALELAFKRTQRQYAVSLNSGSAPNGLPNLIPADPTTGTIGGINLANENLFRPSSYDFDGTLDPGNIEEALDDILLDLTHDGEAPTVIFVGRNIFRLHRAAARDKTQISLGETGFGKQLINLGIKGTTHQGIPMIYDEFMDPNDAYVVNENFLNVHILSSANMKVKELVAPWNQDAIGRRYIMEYQLASWNNYRTHAYVTNN
jgi:hypothetical protein